MERPVFFLLEGIKMSLGGFILLQHARTVNCARCTGKELLDDQGEPFSSTV